MRIRRQEAGWGLGPPSAGGLCRGPGWLPIRLGVRKTCLQVTVEGRHRDHGAAAPRPAPRRAVGRRGPGPGRVSVCGPSDSLAGSLRHTSHVTVALTTRTFRDRACDWPPGLERETGDCLESGPGPGQRLTDWQSRVRVRAGGGQGLAPVEQSAFALSKISSNTN
jgi:hypothetical protein